MAFGISTGGFGFGSPALGQKQVSSGNLSADQSEVARREGIRVRNANQSVSFIAGRGRSLQPARFEEALALSRGLHRSTLVEGLFFDPEDEEQLAQEGLAPGESARLDPRRTVRREIAPFTLLTGRRRRAPTTPGGVLTEDDGLERARFTRIR